MINMTIVKCIYIKEKLVNNFKLITEQGLQSKFCSCGSKLRISRIKNKFWI